MLLTKISESGGSLVDQVCIHPSPSLYLYFRKTINPSLEDQSKNNTGNYSGHLITAEGNTQLFYWTKHGDQVISHGSYVLITRFCPIKRPDASLSGRLSIGPVKSKSRACVNIELGNLTLKTQSSSCVNNGMGKYQLREIKVWRNQNLSNAYLLT